MSDRRKDRAELTRTEIVEGKLNTFLGNNRKIVLIFCIVVLLAIVGVAVATSVNHNILSKQFDQIDQLSTTYSELQTMDKDADEYQAKADELVAQLTELAGKNKKYPALKAKYLLGMHAFDNDDYQQAMDYFLSLSTDAAGTYLGSLSLSNAATCAENLGDDDLALEYYTKIIDDYGNEAAESPKALFGQARLEEKKGNIELAKATFQQLADQFPSSEFAKLARNKLVLL
jgi:tetratricopeptide (TPR) repeat protein